MAERSANILSKPVDKISDIKDATQNHTRTVKTAAFVRPSAVIVMCRPPRLAAQTRVPAAKKMGGIESSAAKAVTKAVLTKKCLSGTLDETANTIGIMQSMSKYDKLKIKREATIIATMATNLAKGLIACNNPFLLLRSSR
jgi:hypothetical protein